MSNWHRHGPSERRPARDRAHDGTASFIACVACVAIGAVAGAAAALLLVGVLG